MFKGSIRNRLIILLLIVTVLPFGTSIIITYYHTKEAFKDLVVQNNSNLLYQGKINMESYLTELNGLTLSLYNNPDFINYMRAPHKEDNYLTLGIVRNILQTVLYAEENIRRVEISFADENQLITVSKRSNVVFSNTVTDKYQDLYERAEQSPNNMYFDTKGLSHGTIYLHRALRNVPSEEVLAYITLEIATEKILDLSTNLYNSENEQFFILSSEGELIYNSMNTVMEEEEWIQQIVKEDVVAHDQFEWRGDDFHGVIMYEQISPTVGGWLLVKRVPYTSLYDNAFTVTKINILFGVVGLTLVILSTLFVSFKITSPIRVLMQNIKQVEKGDMKVQFDSLGKDEIGVLGERFKQMMEKINHLINREYRLEIENKTNQLRALQSQINPHFLYNALQSIGTVALKNNVPQIYTLITHLSKIMRYGMNMEEEIVPLKKEINYIRAFFLLQKERFANRFEYELNIEEEAMDVPVPKMILQPIIENYFKHGFDGGNEIGSITVEGSVEDNELILIVKDNGVGVSEQRLLDIYRHLKNEVRFPKENDGTHIGLKNVYMRLKLYYGESASLKVDNRKEGGWIVTISIPTSSTKEVGMK
ncbi:sensor histidine kinase [Sutcliffiella cohnii]|uniref:sensor histidine kinase n=1 Tax=Sutcliffiella cohnii TaxID=33932 RepID=UPI002E20E1FD|nr:sensor histidine kinase [Sutcliffiella cohnii]